MSKETVVCWLKRAYMVFAVVWVLAFGSGFVRLSFCTGPSMLPTYSERNVNLMVGGDVHILPNGVRATTKLAAAEEAILDVETRLVNLTRARQRIELKTVLSFGDAVIKADTLEYRKITKAL